MEAKNLQHEEIYSGPERRKFKRMKKQFITRFRSKFTTDAWEMVTMQNMGAEGILFNHEREIEPDSILDIMINFPGLKDVLTCSGRVLRSQERPGLNQYSTAAVIFDIKENIKEEINRLIENFLNRKPHHLEP